MDTLVGDLCELIRVVTARRPVRDASLSPTSDPDGFQQIVDVVEKSWGGGGTSLVVLCTGVHLGGELASERGHGCSTSTTSLNAPPTQTYSRSRSIQSLASASLVLKSTPDSVKAGRLAPFPSPCRATSSRSPQVVSQLLCFESLSAVLLD
jgi:hypothetical protein